MNNEYFRKYFLERSVDLKKETKTPGPVITIARDFGCYSSEIANLVTEQINEKSADEYAWRWLSHEILTEAAESLKVEPTRISHIFGAEERPYVQEIIESLTSNKYVCDENIKNTIVRIVRKYAQEGNVIIVGRAGSAVTRYIKQSLHVKLIAPFDWRVKRIQERFQLSQNAAQKKVIEVDASREKFMSFYDGNKPDGELYDAIYNRATMTNEQIVENITFLARSKKIIQ